jgi:hypothetical protein
MRLRRRAAAALAVVLAALIAVMTPDPVLGQGVCAHGGATGDVCGSVLIPAVNASSTLVVNMPVGQWHPGDEGEPFTVDGLLVGLSNHGYNLPAFPAPPVTHTGLTLFSAIMNDVNAKGGPGAGFSPVAKARG